MARDNLGELPAQIAGAALLTDYILTVAVSDLVRRRPDHLGLPGPLRASGRDRRSAWSLFVMLINLRGVKESGAIFAVPTYFFVVMMFLTVGIGLFRYLTGTPGAVVDPPPLEIETDARRSALFLLLHAFSSGTTALTGVEAISNGITAFKEPRSRNAGITLIWMSAILGTLFLGITFLAGHDRRRAVRAARPSSRSWRARRSTAAACLYLAVIAATTVILIMAANTSFADFPALDGAAWRRRLPAPPADLPGQPAGLLAGHRRPGRDRLAADHRLPGQRHRR